MVSIQTATPEQVADCVLGLKRHIDRLEAENQRYRKALERIGALSDSVNNFTSDATLAWFRALGIARVALKGESDG